MMARPMPMKARLSGTWLDSPSDRVMWGTWARKIRIASALTKPSITVRGMKRISAPTPSLPRPIWRAPVRTVAAKR